MVMTCSSPAFLDITPPVSRVYRGDSRNGRAIYSQFPRTRAHQHISDLKVRFLSRHMYDHTLVLMRWAADGQERGPAKGCKINAGDHLKHPVNIFLFSILRSL